MGRLRFATQDCLLTFPKKGKNKYRLENTYCISFKKKIWCTSKKQLTISIQETETQNASIQLSVKTTNHQLSITTETRSTTDILRRVAAIYSDLQLEVQADGTLIKVHNLETIKERWEGEKAYMKKRYGGTQFHKLLKRVDRKISSEHSCIEELLTHEQMGLLCKPLYRMHNEQKPLKLTQKALTEKGAIIVEEQVQLNRIIEAEKQVVLDLKLLEANSYFSSYKGRHTICQESGWLQAATFDMEQKAYGKVFENHFSLQQN